MLWWKKNLMYSTNVWDRRLYFIRLWWPEHPLYISLGPLICVECSRRNQNFIRENYSILLFLFRPFLWWFYWPMSISSITASVCLQCSRRHQNSFEAKIFSFAISDRTNSSSIWIYFINNLIFFITENS